MKITVTKVRKIKEWYDTIGGEEECSAIFHHVTYKRHKLIFRVEMSDGRTYETTHTVNGCDDYHESGWLGNPINDVDQFTRDIQAATFPDLMFFDEYEEHENAYKNAEARKAIRSRLADAYKLLVDDGAYKDAMGGALDWAEKANYEAIVDEINGLIKVMPVNDGTAADLDM